MFDPTVFENLKVALENRLYDLDNLEGRVRIVGRSDLLDMAVMSRRLALRFERTDTENVTAEIRLEASLKDLAAEILEIPGQAPGCALSLRFELPVAEDYREQCGQVERVLRGIWLTAEPPVQTLSFVYGDDSPAGYRNVAEIKFNRLVGEDQMEDLPELIEDALRSMEALEGS
ncbi:hypothetical protein [Cohnella caldifontis]|uniref:hypothetical protein n=1 Tax=Cohnella caldifontis TaxID=3027471 RepID=UPI0023ED13FE|nr:hypothetical protein [Cohnella sp. YIM B05605]